MAQRQCPYEKVENGFFALHDAFHTSENEPLSDEEYDKFRSVLIVFLTFAGWTEDKFYEKLDENMDVCENCDDETVEKSTSASSKNTKLN